LMPGKLPSGVPIYDDVVTSDNKRIQKGKISSCGKGGQLSRGNREIVPDVTRMAAKFVHPTPH
jgi:hypothetical protein